MARRRKIPTATARLVLARSGGYCANPSCRRDLFPVIGRRIATIDQLAHIIAQSPEGPRGDDGDLPLDARDDPENIILLCPTCHALVTI